MVFLVVDNGDGKPYAYSDGAGKLKQYNNIEAAITAAKGISGAAGYWIYNLNLLSRRKP